MAVTSLNISNFRHTIKILQKTITRDDYGAESIIWNTIFTLKSDVKYGAGRKEVETEEFFTMEDIMFTTYYREFTTDCIVLFRDWKYRITNLQEIGYRVGLNIYVEKINE